MGKFTVEKSFWLKVNPDNQVKVDEAEEETEEADSEVETEVVMEAEVVSAADTANNREVITTTILTGSIRAATVDKVDSEDTNKEVFNRVVTAVNLKVVLVVNTKKLKKSNKKLSKILF